MHFVCNSAIIKQPRRDRGETVSLSCSLCSQLSEVDIRRVFVIANELTSHLWHSFALILAACFQKDQQTLRTPFFWSLQRNCHLYVDVDSVENVTGGEFVYPGEKCKAPSHPMRFIRQKVDLSTPPSCLRLLNRYSLIKNTKYLKIVYH